MIHKKRPHFDENRIKANMSSDVKIRAVEAIDYNTRKGVLLYPEYGRNVQMMLEKAMEMEEDSKRQFAVEAIVNMMYYMNPANKNVEDIREKLWSHAVQMVGGDLKVKLPEGIEIKTREQRAKPERVPYPVANNSFRHYGHFVKRLIDKALALEDEEKKEEFSNVIGNYMKVAFRTWNKEHFVTDDVIKDDLAQMSGGNLIIDEDTELKVIRTSTYNNNRGRNNQNNRGGGRFQKNSNQNNRRFKSRK
jgi:hypothetical protein